MKDYLVKLIARKNKELADLKKRNDESTDINEVKAIGSQIESVNAEINEAQAQLDKVEADAAKEAEKETDEARSAFDANAALNVVSTAKMNEQRSLETDELSSMEYRKAFMDYVQRGVKSSVLKFEQRGTDTSGVANDLGVLLPTTVVQEIIKGVEKVYGQLYSRVKKTNIKGGVKYPIGSFSATFHRIAENGKSDRQSAGSVNDSAGSVIFTYNIGEIRIATSLLQSVLSVPVFEQEVAKVIIEAYVKAMDVEIMSGDSSDGEMEGILTEAAKVSSRIPAGNIIEFTAADMADWTKWQEKLFAVIPLSMRGLNPEFVMTANTYEANIKTLKDDNNRPVYNETFNPVDGSEISRFKGKNVVFVEEDILKNFNDATNGQYFGMYWVPEKAYAINTNMEFTMIRYFDQELNQYVDKALVINDGKILDPKYLYLLKKKVTA